MGVSAAHGLSLSCFAMDVNKPLELTTVISASISGAETLHGPLVSATTRVEVESRWRQYNNLHSAPNCCQRSVSYILCVVFGRPLKSSFGYAFVSVVCDAYVVAKRYVLYRNMFEQ